jgi:hypothetical protein
MYVCVYNNDRSVGTETTLAVYFTLSLYTFIHFRHIELYQLLGKSSNNY